MGTKTPLYDNHVALQARMVDFAGWDMPVQYGSLIDEHKSVRNGAGMFDVSHMLAVDITGSDSKAFLQHILANDVGKLKMPGKALYSCMLNPQGGVVDDLIVYFVKDDAYRMVINAGTRDKDLAWMESCVGNLNVALNPQTDLAIIAVQGPEARDKVIALLDEPLAQQAVDIKRFFAASANDWFVGRTGYTGEDGFEVMLPSAEAPTFWDKLFAAGVKPVGLGARDTLRLEAGMNLYGNDMDDTQNPLESGLAWTIAMTPEDRQFIGRDVLESVSANGPSKKLIGLVLEDRGVLRSHLDVFKDGVKIGETTSGTFSPSLAKSIAFARIDVGVVDSCQVEIRSKMLNAIIVSPPFIKNGKANF